MYLDGNIYYIASKDFFCCRVSGWLAMWWLEDVEPSNLLEITEITNNQRDIYPLVKIVHSSTLKLTLKQMVSLIFQGLFARVCICIWYPKFKVSYDLVVSDYMEMAQVTHEIPLILVRSRSIKPSHENFSVNRTVQHFEHIAISYSII
jgi:hypothetical protein